MIEHSEFDDLIVRLERFGDALDVGDTDVSSEVVRSIGQPQQARGRHRWLVAAAVVLLAGGVMVHPDSRRAVARWFGFEGLVVEIDPDLATRPAIGGFDTPGPGESQVVVVGGREILVSAVRGKLSEGLITKTIGAADQIEEVDIKGLRGLWISGAPHQVLYEVDNGEIVVDRVSANTLVWQDADVLYRVEGFANRDDALAFVNTGT